VSAGEWLNYTVSVAASGSYTASFRMSLGQGGTFHLTLNGNRRDGAPDRSEHRRWYWQTITHGHAERGCRRRALDTSGVNAVGNFDSMTFATGLDRAASCGRPREPSGGHQRRQSGDTLAGAVRGKLRAAAKSGSSHITIRSSTPDAQLPADGVRVHPQDAARLAKVQGGFAGMSAFVTAPGAHHYRLQFLEVVNTYANTDIIKLGAQDSTQTSLGTVAHDLIVDRCYIHGDPVNGQKRGIALNSAATTVVNSYISDIKSSQSDAQAIMGSNGPGPYLIANNYLEASGENVLFGGADPFITNLVPSDITIRQNYISRPFSWRGQAWTVKNLIELKNAQRVTIDGNLIENHWAAAQPGFAIVLTPSNQDGNAPERRPAGSVHQQHRPARLGGVQHTRSGH
jgi:hypothetical protein